jgi:hypothetical protein
MLLTQELHVIRAHHLHYLSLLDHYTKHINFIKTTSNPAMDGINEDDRLSSQKLLNRECETLKLEIDRLISELKTQERRLKNVMALVSYIIRTPLSVNVSLFFSYRGYYRYLVASISLTVNICGK